MHQFLAFEESGNVTVYKVRDIKMKDLEGIDDQVILDFAISADKAAFNAKEATIEDE